MVNQVGIHDNVFLLYGISNKSASSRNSFVGWMGTHKDKLVFCHFFLSIFVHCNLCAVAQTGGANREFLKFPSFSFSVLVLVVVIHRTNYVAIILRARSQSPSIYKAYSISSILRRLRNGRMGERKCSVVVPRLTRDLPQQQIPRQQRMFG